MWPGRARKGQEGQNGVLFTLALDQLHTVQGVGLRVDTNDFCRVPISQDGSTWDTLFTVLDSDGTAAGAFGLIARRCKQAAP